MRACRPGPFKKWSVLLRITAYYRVLNGAYYRLAPPGPPDFPENLGVPPGGPRAYPLETHKGFIWSRLVSSDPPWVRRTVHFW